MEILNNFAKKQTKDNFVKTIEIRKEKSIINYIGGIKFSSPLSKINMEIVDCEHQKQNKEFINNSVHANDCKFCLVFNDYQRVKTNELKRWLDIINKYWWQNHYEETGNKNWEYHLDELFAEEDYHNYPPKWLVDNIEWLGINWYCAESYNNIPDWLFGKYLKNEEYCIIYFIDKEKTFNANGWEKE